jgi:hypothetical protein
LQPVKGKGVGDRTEFDGPYLFHAMVRDVEQAAIRVNAASPTREDSWIHQARRLLAPNGAA